MEQRDYRLAGTLSMSDLSLTQTPGTPRIRILLADGTQLVGNDYREAVENLPFVEIVGLAKTSEEALNLFFERKPDVVVVSIILPKLDGMEVLRCINRASSDCPVILLSQTPSAFLEQAAALLGAAGLCSVYEGIADLRRLLYRCWCRKFGIAYNDGLNLA